MATSHTLAHSLAAAGIAALAVAYYGLDGLRPALREVPLEGFANAARWLQQRASVSKVDVGVLGLSRGSEAAMLVGARFDDICGRAVAVAPGNVVLGSWPPGAPAWLLDGAALPHVNTFGPDCRDPDAFIPLERIASLLRVSAGKGTCGSGHEIVGSVASPVQTRTSTCTRS